MRLLVDQNLPPSLAKRLVNAGKNAHHTADCGMAQAADVDIFQWCRNNDAILLTADKRLTKYLASQHAISPSVVVARGYFLDMAGLEDDLLATLDAIEQTILTSGHAVFSMGPNRPTRAQPLPLTTEVG